VAGCRQHETESQPRCDPEITECEQVKRHSRPPGLTDVAADRQTLTAFESIHDCIDMNANASRVSAATTPKFCASATPHRLGPAGGPPRLAFVVILRERMIRRAKLMGREHGSK
jgi:hypothetical protein